MNILRTVSLNPGLYEASAVLTRARDGRPDGDPTADEFGVWWNGSNGLLMKHVIRATEVRPLLDAAPRTPAGIAWIAATEQALVQATADAVRPFDDATYDTDDELAALRDLSALIDELTARSPLLQIVAEALNRQVLRTGVFNIGDLLETRQTLPTIGVDTLLFSGLDHDEYEYAKITTAHLVPWADIDALLPGTQRRLTGILGRLDANLPVVAANDQGAARGHNYGETFNL